MLISLTLGEWKKFKDLIATFPILPHFIHKNAHCVLFLLNLTEGCQDLNKKCSQGYILKGGKWDRRKDIVNWKVTSYIKEKWYTKEKDKNDKANFLNKTVLLGLVPFKTHKYFRQA